MIGNRIVQTLSCLACRVAASFLLHARVIELLESGLHGIGIRRWFLALLSLRPQLWSLLAAKSLRIMALVRFELALRLVDVIAVGLLVVDETGSFREAVQLLRN